MAARATDEALGANSPDGQADADMMARNGIARVRADHYLVDGYRYTNLADALDQVRRGAGRRAGPS